MDYPCDVRSTRVACKQLNRDTNIYVFLDLGHDPRNYDAVVIKTPHAQPEMFDDWAYTNIGVDAPGATTADVSALGHTIARTPTQMLYPMDTGIIYRPQVETIQMAIENALAEAEAEEVA